MAITREFLDANHADLVAAIRAEGRTEGLELGRAEGAQAERARIQAVEAAALPGCEALIKILKFDGKTTGEAAAAQCVVHYKGINAGALERIEADAGKLPKVPAAPSAGGEGDADGDASLPIEERAKKKWDRDAKLRGEFADNFDAYLAYEKRAAKGQIRILGGRK